MSSLGQRYGCSKGTILPFRQVGVLFAVHLESQGAGELEAASVGDEERGEETGGRLKMRGARLAGRLRRQGPDATRASRA